MPFANKDYAYYRCSRGFNCRKIWPRNWRVERCDRKSERIAKQITIRKYVLRPRKSLSKTFMEIIRSHEMISMNNEGK